MRNNSTKPKVHPLFARDRFPARIRYKEVFYDAAVLATRLMDSSQALQSDYCFYFGVNTPIDLPRSIRRRLKPAERPMEYACDNGIGELDDRDIQAVQAERLKLAKRIRYEVDTLVGCVAYTETLEEVDGISGCNSVITINIELYRDALEKRRPAKRNALNSLLLAGAMVHEVGHAANIHLFGTKCEDFREVGLVAEAGFELQSRIFGVTIANEFWQTWQSRYTTGLMRSTGRNITEPRVRHLYLLRDDNFGSPVMEDFLMKLFDDNFWSGEYVRRGAKALIPAIIAQVCRAERDRYERKPGIHRANGDIPISIRDLYRSGGPSYAKRLYHEFSNPDLILRSEQAGIESDVVSSGDDSSETTSAGEFDNSGEQQHTGDETSDVEDSDKYGGEDGDEDGDVDGEYVEEEGSDVEQEDEDVDEDEMSVDEDAMDVNEDAAPAPKNGKTNVKSTGSKRVREDSDHEDEAPAPKKTKNPSKKSRR